MNAPTCRSDEHCITCGDVGVPMTVVALRGHSAICVDADGARQEVAVELVEPVELGRQILVHAGVAIA